MTQKSALRTDARHPSRAPDHPPLRTAQTGPGGPGDHPPADRRQRSDLVLLTVEEAADDCASAGLPASGSSERALWNPFPWATCGASPRRRFPSTSRVCAKLTARPDPTRGGGTPGQGSPPPRFSSLHPQPWRVTCGREPKGAPVALTARQASTRAKTANGTVASRSASRTTARPDRRHVERKTEAEIIKAVRELEKQRDGGKVRKPGKRWTVAAWLDALGREHRRTRGQREHDRRVPRGCTSPPDARVSVPTGSTSWSRSTSNGSTRRCGRRQQAGDCPPGAPNHPDGSQRGRAGDGTSPRMWSGWLRRRPLDERGSRARTRWKRSQRLLEAATRAAASGAMGIRRWHSVCGRARPGAASGRTWTFRHGDDAHPSESATAEVRARLRRNLRQEARRLLPGAACRSGRRPKGTKSRAGKRTIGLPPQTRRPAGDAPGRPGHRAEEGAAALDGFVRRTTGCSPTTLGKPVNPRYGLRRVEAAPDGTPKVRDGRLHDARHTAATVLLILGIPDTRGGWRHGLGARERDGGAATST